MSLFDKVINEDRFIHLSVKNMVILKSNASERRRRLSNVIIFTFIMTYLLANFVKITSDLVLPHVRVKIVFTIQSSRTSPFWYFKFILKFI
jgi:hypothetical protein